MHRSLFITDLDGTLLRDDKTISREDFEALDCLKTRGVITAIATGRSLYSFRQIMKTHGIVSKGTLPVDYVIFSTGAGIMTYPDMNIVKKLSLDGKEVIEICDCFDRMRFDYMVHYPIPDTNKFMYKSQGTDNPDFYDRIDIYHAFATAFTGCIGNFGPATQILSVVPEKMPERVMKDLAQKLEPFSMIQTTSPLDKKSFWIEVFHKNASKSQAARWLSEQLNIFRAHVAAIGNDYNDQDLLEWCGTGYIVENAPSDLKKGLIEMPSNNHNAVARAVDHFFARQS